MKETRPFRELEELEALLVHPQHQERSKARFEKILDVTETLVREEGYEGMQVSKICKLAGCNTSTFYQRFADKDALFVMVQIRCYKRARETWEENDITGRMKGLSLEECVSFLAKICVNTNRTNEVLYRIFAQHTGRHPLVHEAMLAMNYFTKRKFEEILYPRKAEIRHPDPGFAIQMGAQVCMAMCTTTLLIDPGPHSLHDRNLEKNLAEIYMFILNGGAHYGAFGD